MFSLFQHKHYWQARGVNRYGLETYRVCLKCKKAYVRINKPGFPEKWEQCDRIKELDDQFDDKGNYII